MTDRFEFDSEGMEPEAAFQAYRTLYSHGSDVSRAPGPFRARVQAIRLEGLLLFQRELDGVIHARGEDRVAHDRFDHFALHLVVEGALEGSPESGFERAGPDDLVVVDTTRPSRTRAVGLKVLTVSMPRIVLAASGGDPARLHGRIVSAPHTLVPRDLMLSIVRNASSLPPETLGGLARMTAELLTTALEVSGPATSAARLDLLRKEMAVRYIASRLSDRDLDAARVVEGAGLSRSMLYRLFAHSGGVAEYIMSRRLAAVRDMLERGSTAPLSSLALSFGFADESHLNRRFSRAYGEPAGAFRRALADVASGRDAPGGRRWASWLIEVG